MLFSLRHLPCLSPLLPQPKPIRSRHQSTLPANISNTSLRDNFKFLAKAASISSPGADYPGKLVDDAQRKQRRRRRSVAGVDQEDLVDPEKLADPDSFFCEFNGVQVHHKICDHEAEEEVKEQSFQVTGSGVAGFGLPMILLHGFGASVFSWDRVMKPLARLTGSKVLAFDRPAFGLTSRASVLGQQAVGGDDARPLNPYSMAFSVLATLSFMDLLGAGKAILMGHSAGCLVAVNTYFEAPEKVAALILIAPAIVAPLISQKVVKENEMDKGNQIEDRGSNLNVRQHPSVRIWKALCKLCMGVIGVAFGMLKGMRDMVSSLYVKAVSAVLRSAFAVMLLRMIMDKFGILAIRNAWFDASQITDHVLQGYTKPLRAKGWEMALLEYTLAVLTDSASKPPLTKRLAEISCPVLIITGDTDRLVPSWNAERLSWAIPGSTLEVIKNCGHLPHEERVEEFLLAIERFLQKVFGVSDRQFSQAAA
ncbi:uncharacterized protein LOC103706004 isoform X2 [Phoenix dactylifera]|uniref:Uncharacterized protein LOC103706004 isoform X2 n=1 Tax=Phoenix dactylifera TaxID=42345 RepID=A0A8B9APH1_PHODC|nr:uncharacterized protein LOC103706004 isoform X2 [Phoenix dactylifera]